MRSTGQRVFNRAEKMRTHALFKDKGKTIEPTRCARMHYLRPKVLYRAYKMRACTALGQRVSYVTASNKEQNSAIVVVQKNVNINLKSLVMCLANYGLKICGIFQIKQYLLVSRLCELRNLFNLKYKDFG